MGERKKREMKFGVENMKRGRGKGKSMRKETGRSGEEGGRPEKLRGCRGRASSAPARGGRLKAESQQAVEERNKS